MDVIIKVFQKTYGYRKAEELINLIKKVKNNENFFTKLEKEVEKLNPYEVCRNDDAYALIKDYFLKWLVTQPKETILAFLNNLDKFDKKEWETELIDYKRDQLTYELDFNPEVKNIYENRIALDDAESLEDLFEIEEDMEI